MLNIELYDNHPKVSYRTIFLQLHTVFNGFCKIFKEVFIMTQQYFFFWKYLLLRSRRGHDHMVLGFTTTYAVSAYHH
jgi:hypothetical protein